MAKLITVAEFTNEQFLGEEGHVRYWTGGTAVVTVGSYETNVELCAVVFGKDGSIYVTVGAYPGGSGIVANTPLIAREDGGATISLREGGFTTRHLVKFSHHPDGEAHFSQNGKVRTLVRRVSFPLASSKRYLFHVRLYNVREFRAFDPARRRRGRIYVRKIYPESIPFAISVDAEWHLLTEVEAWTRDAMIGPWGTVVNKDEEAGAEKSYCLIRPPRNNPYANHLLLLRCETALEVPEISAPAFILIGGLDAPRAAKDGAPAAGTGCLACMYPVSDIAGLETALGSIDIDLGASGGRASAAVLGVGAAASSLRSDPAPQL